MAGGRKPGTPKTGGRQKGTLNKATADIKALAQKYAPEIIANLARLALEAESEQAQVAATKELLDRGFGRPSQGIGQADDLGPLQIKRIERTIVDPKA